MGQTNKNDSDNTVAKELKQRNKNNNRRIKQEYGRYTYNSERDAKEDLEEFYEWNDDEFEKFSRNGKR
jgi:hypothetical protein